MGLEEYRWSGGLIDVSSKQVQISLLAFLLRSQSHPIPGGSERGLVKNSGLSWDRSAYSFLSSSYRSFCVFGAGDWLGSLHKCKGMWTRASIAVKKCVETLTVAAI